jgi:transcriptional regulator GlxA family with amidase domain
MAMKTVALPLLRTGNSIGAVGPIEILTKTCALWRHLKDGKSRQRLFEVEIVAEQRKPITFANGITINPSAGMHEVEPDLIVVPSIEEDVDSALENNRPYVEWIKERFKRGAHLASFCTGAFLLGESGVLDGKRATTHWFFAEEFRRRFPRVMLQEEYLLIDEGNIVTCGGATSFLNLMIYLIEKYFGHELAVHASKIFLIDMDRPSQRPFKIHSFSVTHGEQAIARIQEFLAEHFHEGLPVEDMAKRAGMSVRNFSRRFKAATGEKLSRYVQLLRLERAKHFLENTDSSASEIMERVGYSDERSFRRVFKRHTGLAPRDYRNKFKLRFENSA